MAGPGRLAPRRAEMSNGDSSKRMWVNDSEAVSLAGVAAPASYVGGSLLAAVAEQAMAFVTRPPRPGAVEEVLLCLCSTVDVRSGQPW